METPTMNIEQAARDALRGEKLMVGVYGGGVDILVAIERKDVPACISGFTERCTKRDPVDMAQMALRAMMLVAGGHPPHAQFGVVAPALVLASSTPQGIDGAIAIEITVREKDFLVEIYDLDNWKTSETVH